MFTIKRVLSNPDLPHEKVGKVRSLDTDVIEAYFNGRYDCNIVDLEIDKENNAADVVVDYGNNHVFQYVVESE